MVLIFPPQLRSTNNAFDWWIWDEFWMNFYPKPNVNTWNIFFFFFFFLSFSKFSGLLCFTASYICRYIECTTHNRTIPFMYTFHVASKWFSRHLLFLANLSKPTKWPNTRRWNIDHFHVATTTSPNSKDHRTMRAIVFP